MHSTSSSIHLPSESSTSATLRSLYPRATKSFVQRDFTLTQTLLNSAFELLAPPSGLEDSYAQQRRKWDILRITLETTAYASPPESTADLPPALRANTLETPQGLISRMHARSLRLFTPTAYTPSPGFLPAQILVTLVLSSLKHECPQVARALIEQWLGHRRPRDEEAIEPGDAEGYEKVLDIYCIHVLPRLEEWDYAKEFLSYERELSTEKRQNLRSVVEAAQDQALANRQTVASRVPPSPTSTSSGYISPSRTPSPSPSVTSSTSSTSSTSTHTARPPGRPSGGLQPLSSVTTTTVVKTKKQGTVHTSPLSRALSGASATNGHANSSAAFKADSQPLPVPPRAPTVEARPIARPSSLSALASTTRTHLSALLAHPQARLAGVLAAVFALLPLLAFLARLRAARTIPRRAPAGAANDVRRRLMVGKEGRRGGVLGAVWGEVVKVLLDTVRMAGRGLV